MHASIRAKDLTAGNELPLDFSRGMIIAFKSSSTFNSAISNWDQAPLINRTDIDLCNINDDIILRITLLRGENKVFFNDRAGKSLLNARGQEQSANLSPMDVNKLLYPGVTISVHDCSTPSKEQYQILFDLTTVYYFDKRFPGPPIKIIYSVQQWPHASTTAIRPLGILSDPLKVFTCNLDDLPVKEKQAIRSGFAPMATPAPDSLGNDNLVPHFKQCACMSSEDGKEIRIYYLGHGNVLQEYAYSSKNRMGWHWGTLDKLNIILDPTSSIAAIENSGRIWVYYQDPDSGFIREVTQLGPSQEWKISTGAIARAVNGSSIAVVRCSDSNGIMHSRVYYQCPDLHLRESYLETSTVKWVSGDFNPGIQPCRTPITADLFHGGDITINVMWRNAQGRPASGSWSKILGWDLPNAKMQSKDGTD